MEKNKNKANLFFKKYKKMLIFASFVIISSIAFFYFVMASDSDSNKLTINSISISKIDDGSFPFDSDDSAGNDSNSNNGIVRNFDSVNYTVNFNLTKKNDVDEVNISDFREIIVDVIFNGDVNGTIYAGANPSENSLSNIFGNYKYVEFTEQAKLGSNEIYFSLSSMNLPHGSKINPIVIIKEATDEEATVISDLSEEQKNESYDSISSFFNKSTCDNMISNNKSCEVTVSSIENYTVSLYQGSVAKETSYTTIPIGIMLSLEERTTSNNENKGIKGLIVPSSLSFDINAESLNNITYVDNSLRSYKSKVNNPNNGFDYSVYVDEGNTIELPELLLEDYDGNGNVSVSKINESGKLLHIDIDNIQNKVELLPSMNKYYFETSSFEILSTRNSTSHDDINIFISATNGDKTYSTLNIIDTYKKTIGTYESEINLYDSLDDLAINNKKENGLGELNYNEDFYIESKFKYGAKSGDGLDNLTSFVKIDNEAIKLTLLDGVEYKSNVRVINSNYREPQTSSVYFGYGSWDSEHFSIRSDAPEGCPTDISSLSKENLMNLYGGPCIEEISNRVKWVNNFDGLDEEGNKVLTDSEKNKGPIIVRTVYIPNANGEFVYPTSSGELILRAKVKNNYSLVNTSHQIVSSATALFTKENESQALYYLNEDLLKNLNNFVKTDYDFNNKKVNSINSTSCDNPLTCTISGNTVLVSGVRVARPEVNTYYNDIDTTSFYDYPIEFRINASAYKNDIDNNTSFKSARVNVYIPSYLKYISYENKVEKEPSSIETVSLNNMEYSKITYNYSSDEITKGLIPTLSVYTSISLDTPNNFKPIVYVEADFDVIKRILNEDSTYNTVEFSSISSSEKRTKVIDNIILHNNKEITTSSIVSPMYIEKNKSYTYNMKAFNNSEEHNFNNASLYYVLPYNNDSSYDTISSKFSASNFKVKITNLPNGYRAYYTNGVSSNIVNNELNDTTNKGFTWIEWTTPTNEISDITAIKIVSPNTFNSRTYFGSSSGIELVVTPINSSYGDTFYNSFTMVVDKPSNLSCNNSNQCNNGSSKLYYTSSRSMTSVYNRNISGVVFEDYNYNGVLDEKEKKLDNIPISVYKLEDNTKEYDSNNPSTYVEDGVWVADTTTSKTGEFIIRGLSEGRYYVKYTYDNDKYTPTDKDIIISTANTNLINSKALPLADSNVAISSVISLNSDITKASNINLGLKIRKKFAVDINKYITKIDVKSFSGTQTHNYDKATQVTLNVRNPRNTSLKVTYSFVIENTKYFPGKVGIIADRLPNKMTFNPSIKENQDWTLYGDTLYYTGLSNRLLMPNNKYYFNLVLDLDLEEAGTYTNVVATRDLIMMDEDLPTYDFSTLELGDR